MMITRRSALGMAAMAAALASMGLLSTGCGKKTPLAEGQKDYAGKWVAADGTYVHVFMDGSGAFKMASSSVEGGSATIAGDTLTIGMGPIKKDFKVTEAPKKSGNSWTMTLDGIKYTKQ